MIVTTNNIQIFKEDNLYFYNYTKFSFNKV